MACWQQRLSAHYCRLPLIDQRSAEWIRASDRAGGTRCIVLQAPAQKMRPLAPPSPLSPQCQLPLHWRCTGSCGARPGACPGEFWREQLPGHARSALLAGIVTRQRCWDAGQSVEAPGSWQHKFCPQPGSLSPPLACRLWQSATDTPMCRCRSPGAACTPSSSRRPRCCRRPARRLTPLSTALGPLPGTSCRTVKAFYQGSIRSGFVAHSDEDDPQVLQRIHAQAAKDAEWLVAKVGG